MDGIHPAFTGEVDYFHYNPVGGTRLVSENNAFILMMDCRIAEHVQL
jgi:hypothetical protein